ncbi:hypothetical protein [Pseudomonas sp. OST1909]|uniref:hypothetical protein n=1 Tax=Pseudomonas sp. OST1909 TaxID=2777367 RepID=UPI00188820EE|nr:hypothetical protein [Pseudomonas sp. OST1909]QOY71178.1 hypothetical protein IH404_26110 [Pseudomonas sp. OST1909]
MNSINLQTTLQNLYNQVGAHVPTSKARLIDPNVLHNLGLSANLLQNLRNDLSGVANGSNPERALNNLMSGLKQVSGSSNALAKEWPAGKPVPEGAVRLADLGAQEWPADKPLPEGGVRLADLGAKDWPAGKPLPEGAVRLADLGAQDWPADKPLPEGGVRLADLGAQEWPAGKPLPEGAVRLADLGAKDWPAGKPLPEGAVRLADLGAQDWPAGKPLPEGAVRLADLGAKDWPADKPLPEGGVHTVKGADGQLHEVDASGAPRSDLANVPSSVQTSADAVISNLLGVLGAQAAGGNISQASEKMRAALDSLFDRTNPTQVRDALRNSINELA